jgi:hypothetical protein
MPMWLDKQYIDRIRFNLAGFVWRSQNVANFRCPLCGDSQRNLRKKRGFFFADHDHDCMRWACHNCHEKNGWSFGFWLKDFDPSLYKEYQLELFKESGQSISSNREPEWRPPKITRTQPLQIKKSHELPRAILEHATPISMLPPDHMVVRYAESRRLPEKAKSILCYTDDYRSLVEHLDIENVDAIEKLPQDARLIIPLLTENWELMGVQGRALDKNSFQRYITNKIKEHYPKLFGLHSLNKKKPILVVEGPIDSMFLGNAVATADSNLLSYEAGTVYVPDNQYRNREICNIVEHIIDSGKNICIFPKDLEHFKDINDMVMYGNISPTDIMKIIASNTFNGLKAKMVWATRRGI